jgi:Mn2+/Fe2+ NRAMP family transporter
VKSTILKAKRIVDIKLLLFFLGLWIVEFALIHFLLKIIATNKNLLNAWQDFFLFEDMGVPQGFILIPLLYFASRMKMKQDIVIEIKKINTKLDLDKLKISTLYNWIAISFWGLLIGLNVLFALPEIWNILLTLILLLFRAFQRI